MTQKPSSSLLLLLLLYYLAAAAAADNAAAADHRGQDKPGGTIHDLFNTEPTSYFDDAHTELKDRLNLNEALVEEQFRRVEKKLSKQIEQLRQRGSDAVPVTTFDKIRNNNGRVPEGVAEKVRRRGVLVVRGVIPPEEMKDLLGELLAYMYANHAFPQGANQSVYEIYWSKSQMSARQHPNMHLTQRALNGLYHTMADADAADKDAADAAAVDADISRPLMYVDRLRMRPPGDSSFTLPPHVDGGGIERWKDDTYRMVYRKILDGRPDDYDPFEVDYRVGANMNELGSANGCSFFRTFQGWLSLSDTGPGEGTLRVLPLLKEATAYWMLRPFLSDVPRNLFPGIAPGKTMHINREHHPLIADELVSIPAVGPGDTVWWHPDLIHSVEPVHGGAHHSSVFYIPSGFDCAINRAYLRRQRHAFVLGRTPPDFPPNHLEEGFDGRATLRDVTPLGRQMMGWTDEEWAEEQELEQQDASCPRTASP